ncbi:MAG: hydroxymethylbilane synthase [SAR202 cluster bacterium]|nr:hydroxymethylbilane synthase [SAR202 cluster bacterium]
MTPLIVGTRGSRLALIQTEEALALIRAKHPAQAFDIKTIRTGGDKAPDVPLASLGRGVFVKEIEDALLRKEIDLAVHSLKDLPPVTPPCLAIAAITQRIDPRDVLVSKENVTLDKLPPGARIGTSSPRRTAQLRRLRPDLQALPIRGNVDTRVNKAFGPDYDGVILAAAGLIRLGLQSKISQYFSAEEFIPDPGQGALAIEVRQDDNHTLALLKTIDHSPTRRAVTAERAFLEKLGMGCSSPSAAYARVSGDSIIMYALLASPDSAQSFTTKARGNPDNPRELAAEALQRLIEKGAAKLFSPEKQ